jgi:hypothetical protein
MFHANGDPVVAASLSREYEAAARSASKPVTAVYYDGVRHPAVLPPVAGTADPVSKADANSRALAFLRAALVNPGIIEGTATGAEQVPSAAVGATARVNATFNSQTNDLGYTITVGGLSPAYVTEVTINRGAKGNNGPVLHSLPTSDSHAISGWLRLTPAEAADLRAGNLYLNLQSQANPGGFARLQLTLRGGSAGSITPPNTGDAGLAENPATAGQSLLLAGLGAILATILASHRRFGRRLQR